MPTLFSRILPRPARRSTAPVLSHLPPGPEPIQQLLHGMRVEASTLDGLPLVSYVSPKIEEDVLSDFPQVAYYGPFKHPKD